MTKAIRHQIPDLAKKYVNELNDLMSFADDNNILSDNLTILKNSIECLNLEIKKIGI